MNVSIVLPSEAPGPPTDIAVVADVLRATTTATVLCKRLGELFVLRTPADLEHLPARSAGYVLFSELSKITSDLMRFDNSPVSARDADLGGRTPVLVTTNGTLAIGLAMQFAREVLLVSFANLSAVVDYIRARGVASVALMPAGNINKAQRCAEDDGCIDALAARLDGRAIDIPAVMAACRGDARIKRREENEPNLAVDLEVCFALDAIPVVPRVVGAPDQRWFGVERA